MNHRHGPFSGREEKRLFPFHGEINLSPFHFILNFPGGSRARRGRPGNKVSSGIANPAANTSDIEPPVCTGRNVYDAPATQEKRSRDWLSDIFNKERDPSDVSTTKRVRFCRGYIPRCVYTTPLTFLRNTLVLHFTD